MKLKDSVQKEEWITPRLVKFSDNNVESGVGPNANIERLRFAGNNGLVDLCGDRAIDLMNTTLTTTINYDPDRDDCNCDNPTTRIFMISQDGTIAQINRNRNFICS